MIPSLADWLCFNCRHCMSQLLVELRDALESGSLRGCLLA